MVQPTETAKTVVDQLAKYGAVTILTERSGRLVDATGGIWYWTVYGNNVTIEHEEWRTRTVLASNISEYMFRWLFDNEITRSSLEFPMTLEGAIELFGIDAVHEAFKRFLINKLDE